MDLRAATSKLTELRSLLSSVELPEPSSAACPSCGIRTKGPLTLAEHLYLSHDGPLPEHLERLETLIG